MPINKKDELINRSFSENALKMMKKRYLNTKKDGTQETPADMFHRVSKALAEVEKDYGRDKKFVSQVEADFFDILTSKDFTPAGRTMTNAGTDQPIVANCIVLPIHDSMDSIFQTLKDAALLQQAGSGLGFSLDELRPAMSVTKRSRGTSSGPIAFLDVYNHAFGIIKQQGRHGANMAMMSVDHPDILDFINCKKVEGSIRNFNISIKVTDEFMKMASETPNKKWLCTWKGEKVKPKRILRHSNGAVYGAEEVDITVGQLMDEIVHYAWLNGEPGIVFIDAINRTNPLPGMGRIECSNPCGEQFLHPYDNCNLGSINLANFVKNGKVLWDRLQFVTKTSTRMLDNVIDRFDFPVKAVTDLAKANRRIGLGIMGFADMLYQLGIKYNSKEGLAMADKVMGFIQKNAHAMSQQLAKEKGAFPNIGLSVFAKKKVKMRNAALTTIAPTGSISMMFDTSSGCEPNFALAYIKQDKDGVQYPYLNKYFEAELNKRGFSKDKIEKIKQEAINKGSIQHLTDLPKDLRDTFVVSMDLSGEDHVRMQGILQKNVDNSISKTINFPNTATKDDIRRGYIEAWKSGCKSCTVYRDGSRNVQVLNIGDASNIVSMTEDPNKVKKAKDGKTEAQTEVKTPAHNHLVDQGKLSPRERPAVMTGRTYKIKTGYGNLYVTVNNDEQGAPFEVFATIGKSGGYFQEQSEGLCRLISLALRAGIKSEEVINILKGIRGPMPVLTEKGTILSLPDAIAQIMEEHVSSGAVVKSEASPAAIEAKVSEPAMAAAQATVKKQLADYGFMPQCPDCSATLVLQEGCMSCKSCGFSRCM